MATPTANKPQQQKITVASIAEQTGFGRSTVGHVLSGRGQELGIRPETIDLILKAARENGYVANPLARGLRGQRTNAIGVLWTLDGFANGESTLRPLTEAIARQGCVTYLFDHGAMERGPLEILKNLQLRGADGVVILLNVPSVLDIPGMRDLIRSFPLRVLVTPEPIDFDADIVVYDRKAAQRAATEALLQAGRRRLLYVTNHLPPNLYKFHTIQETVAAFGHGAAADAIDLQRTRLRGLVDCFDADPRCAEADAMLFSSDDYAAAGMRWLHCRGRRCPQDVAVVGFNNSEYACVLTPPLATVDRVDIELVEQIDQLIRNRRSNPDSDCQHRLVAMRYVPRESAGTVQEKTP